MYLVIYKNYVKINYFLLLNLPLNFKLNKFIIIINIQLIKY